MTTFGRKTASPPGPRRRPGPPPLLARPGRFALVVIVITGAFLGIGCKLFWLQYYESRYLSAKADDARRYSRPSRAERGQIRDSHDTVLAKSREVWDIGVDPSSLTPQNDDDVERIASELARILKLRAADLVAVFRHKFREIGEHPAPGEDESGTTDTADDVSAGLGPKLRPIRWVKIAEGVSDATRDSVVAKMAELRVKAVYASRRFERDYPYGKLSSQLIGYVNKEGKPSMGIEKAFDFFLTGEDGWVDSQWDGKHRESPDRRIREVKPRDGNSVILTIDANVQQLAEAELGKACEEYHPEWGIAIVSEAKTGRILALTNWPTFDLNAYNDLTKSPLVAQKNRAVTDVYEPGSVFKIVSYAAAFKEGLITADTMIDCGPDRKSPFFVPYKGKLYKLPKDDENLGRVDVRRAIAKSSNRAAAQIGMRVAEVCGEKKFWDYLAGFGFGSYTGLVTGSEVRGRLKKPEEWDWAATGATITRLPMGHSVDVTALQTHFAMGVIASGGDLLAPLLVSRVVDRDGATVCDFAPVVRRHVIPKNVAAQVADLLRGVVSKDGTGRQAIIPGYDVAGKTGTTAILVKNPATGKFEYSETRNVASFCGFLPAEDPQIVISVIMRDPSGKGQAFGGAYSAPVFKAIAEGVIKWLKIPPHNQQEYDAAQDKLRGRAPRPAALPARPEAPRISFPAL